MTYNNPLRTDRPSTVRTPPVVVRRALFELLSSGVSGGVTLVSAPPGGGKTVLIRSWIDHAGLNDRVAWVSVERGERDAQRFWLAVVQQLRAAGADALVEQIEPAPGFVGDTVVDRLVSQLGSLDELVVLVIDDLHELSSPEALAQLERLLALRPPLLRVVLATRHDPQLGLHRLRLVGQLTELRASDLYFSPEEARELLTASEVSLSDAGLALLLARTEGWAAGLRLAALALAGHPDPERFVAEFSGSERTVADYLLAEVLARQPDEVRRLLLRTSILERINGPLADTLVGTPGSERILLALEQANAFVVALDAERSWFRYHHLFADLLRLELRRTNPSAVVPLHRAAAEWYAAHGEVVDAVRHAQAAEDWTNATDLLIDQTASLLLRGQDATVGALLTAFPQEVRSDPRLVVVIACYQLVRGSIDDAAAHIDLARRHAGEVPGERRRRFEMLLAVARLSLAVRRGDFGSVLNVAQPLLEPVADTFGEVALGNDLRAAAVMNLGIAEVWSWQIDAAIRHLEEGLALGRRLDLRYVETGCLSHLAFAVSQRSMSRGRERCVEAVAVAEAHGWANEPIVCVALVAMAWTEVWQGRFAEALPWLERADLALRPDLEPTTALLVHLTRGILHLGQSRLEPALAAFRAAEQCQTRLVTRHALTALARQFLVSTLVRLDQTAGARAELAAITHDERDWGEACAAVATLHLAEGDAQAAAGALSPVLNGDAPVLGSFTMIQALLLDAVAHDRLGAPQAANVEIERALDLAESDTLIFPFVMTSARDLLERRLRYGTAHATLLADILDVLAGSSLPPRADGLLELHEDLSESELRVLRYLPSNLSAPEIAAELYVSTSTVKTHMRHIYAKLDAHRRTEAVEHARALGLLGPSPRHRR
jgi:LuxR family maltose regulon positive regulatory protein